MSAPAGWYPDPEMVHTQRYWDGDQWTQHRAPAPPTTTSAATEAPMSAPVATQLAVRPHDTAGYAWALAFFPLVGVPLALALTDGRSLALAAVISGCFILRYLDLKEVRRIGLAFGSPKPPVLAVYLLRRTREMGTHRALPWVGWSTTAVFLCVYFAGLYLPSL